MESNPATQCPQCGNVFKADSIFCRKCGLRRGEYTAAARVPASAPNLQQSPQMIQRPASQGQIPATALGLSGQQSPVSLGQASSPVGLGAGQAMAPTLLPNNNAMPTMQAASPCMAAHQLQQLPQTLPSAPAQWSGQPPAQVPASLPILQQAQQVAQATHASPVQGQSLAILQQFPGQPLQAASPLVASQMPMSAPNLQQSSLLSQMTQPSVMQTQASPQEPASNPAMQQVQGQPFTIQGHSPTAGSFRVSQHPCMTQSFPQPMIQAVDPCRSGHMPMLPLQSRGGQVPYAGFDVHGGNESALTTQAAGPSPIPMVEAGQPFGVNPMYPSGGPCNIMQTVPQGIQDFCPSAVVAYPEFLQEQLVQPSPIDFSALKPASEQDHDIGFYEVVGAPQELSQEPGNDLPSNSDQHQVAEPGKKNNLLASRRLEGGSVHSATSPKRMANILGSSPLSGTQVQGDLVCPNCSAELIEFHRQDRLTDQLDAHKAASDRIFRENRQLRTELEELNVKLQESEGRASPGSDLESKLQRLEELQRHVLVLQRSNDSYQAQLRRLQDQTGHQGLVEKLNFAGEAENVVSENTALKAKILELEAELTQQKADCDADAFVLQATVTELETNLQQEDSGLAAENARLQATVEDLQNSLAQSADASVENAMLKQKLAGLEGRLARMSDGADTTSFQNIQLQNKVAELEAELERLNALSAFSARAAASPTAPVTQQATLSQHRQREVQPSLPKLDRLPDARVTELAAGDPNDHGTISFSDAWGLLNSYDDRPGGDLANGSNTFHFYDQQDQHGIPSLPVIAS
eukprot:TRINITY_DN11261_c0_g1_i3.p1 TRINITY_DN11261_c0_g1~~TRINITY_DN11261_c0_g1_i3.p1  ORF type:complete len:806 (-),score=162.78 TRINITY_DN11261_c0_g1_i3:204-2621(-)